MTRSDRSRLLLVLADQQRSYLSDHALVTLAQAAGPSYDVVVATAQPTVTSRRTGFRAIDLDRRNLLRHCRAADAVVLVGGELGEASSRQRCANLGLLDLLALAQAARVGGGNWLMWGIGLGRVERKRTRFLIRQLVVGSDLFLAESGRVANRLVDIGVPAPVRKGVGPIWLGLGDLGDLGDPGAEPDRDRDDVRVILGRSATDPAGEHALTTILTTMVTAAEPTMRVGIQPWLMGRDAELALDAMGHQVSQLQRRGIDADAVLPDANVDAARSSLAHHRLVITSSESAVPVALSSGVPTVYVADAARHPLATRLEVPILGIGEHTRVADARAAITRAESGLSAQRQHVNDLRERADGSLRLVKILLDPEAVVPKGQHRLADDPLSGIRPIGVLR